MRKPPPKALDLAEEEYRNALRMLRHHEATTACFEAKRLAPTEGVTDAVYVALIDKSREIADGYRRRVLSARSEITRLGGTIPEEPLA